MFPDLNFSIIANSMVYVMPFILLFIIWEVWVRYVQAHYIYNLEWHLLEIKFPRELLKSPAAMEVVLSSIHQTSDGNLLEKYWKGKVRPWFSLEITSFAGELHFYIRTEKKFKNLIEAQIYSQYPDIEIYPVDDYTGRIPYGLPTADWDMFGVEFALAKEDPYPIKTYVDYGLDREPSEVSFQVDPITPMIEMMGAIKPGEEFWLQYLIMATKDRRRKQGAWFAKEGWKEEGQALVNDILKRKAGTKGPNQVSDTGFPILPSISKGEQDIVEAIERNISKLGFDVGMRMIYFAKKDVFDPVNISSMLGCVKQFGSSSLNGFKPDTTTDFNYPWQDFNGWRLAWMKRRIFDSYRRRSYFYPPYVRKPFVLNSEELATVYHFPGQVAQTPSLSRIESKRAEPPTNLPI